MYVYRRPLMRAERPRPWEYHRHPLVQGARFDGANDWLTRGADLTGNIDANTGTIAAWVRVAGDGTTMAVVANSGLRFWMGRNASGNRALVRGRNTFDNVSLVMDSTTGAITASKGWIHLLAAWDTDINAAHLYVDGIDVLDGTPTASGIVDYTRADWAIGAWTPADSSLSKWHGDIAELWFSHEYLDLSAEENRRKFISPAGGPVDLGTDGSEPTGTAPILYLRGNHLAFGANSGTGGDFSVAGALDPPVNTPGVKSGADLALTLSIQPGAIPSAEAFGSPAVVQGLLTLAPAGIPSAEAFGAPQAVAGPVSVQAVGVASAEAFGSLAVSPGAASIIAEAIASAEAFGAVQVLRGAVVVSPAGIVTAEAFGSAQLLRDAVAVAPVGIPSAEAFGAAALAPGTASVQPAGVASAEAFGDAELAPGGVDVEPSGVESAEAFGAPELAQGVATVQPSGVPSAEAFGSHQALPGGVDVAPAGMASAEAFGSATLAEGVATVSPPGIASAEAFGLLTMAPGAVEVEPAGIAGAEAFGAVEVQPGALLLLPPGIASGEVFGDALILPGATVIQPAGVVSAEAFGALRIIGGEHIVGWLVARVETGLALTAVVDVGPALTVESLEARPALNAEIAVNVA